MKKVLVLGGGLAGLASALLAASAGDEVTLLEAATCGGKSARVMLDGQTIDTGPAVWSFPAVWDEVFRRAGLPGWAEVPHLKLASLGVHHGKTVLSLPPEGPDGGWDAYAARVQQAVPTIEQLLVTPPRLLDPTFQRLGARLFGVLQGKLTARSFLRSLQLPADLEEALAVYALNTGITPERASALHALVPYGMLQDLRVPIGGIHELVLRLKAACVHLGVQVLEHTPVHRVEQGRVHTAAGAFAGEVISTLDFDHLRTLMGETSQRKGLLSCSGLVVYGVLEDPVDLPFHSVLLPDDAARLGRELQQGTLPASPMAFVNHYRPAEVYPQNTRAVLSVGLTVPADAQTYGLDHPWLQAQLRRAAAVLQVPILQKLRQTCVLHPRNLFRLGTPGGSIYGRLGSIWRSGPWHQPGYRHRGVWLAGSSVHPGGGIPGVLGGALMLHQIRTGD